MAPESADWLIVSCHSNPGDTLMIIYSCYSSWKKMMDTKPAIHSQTKGSREKIPA